MLERTSVTVDLDQMQQAKDLGFNISMLLRTAISEALDSSNEDLVFEMRLGRLDNLILELRTKESTLQQQLDYTRDRLKSYLDERQKLDEDWQKARSYIQIKTRMITLNKIIIHSQYDHEVIREAGKDLLGEILVLNPYFDLDKHIDNLQYELSR